MPRLDSLDVFRGLIIAAMIVVTDPGTYAAVYAPLAHSVWERPTATDLISPAFLLIVGVSMVLSYDAALARGASHGDLLQKTTRRAGLLFLLGLALNALPWLHLATLRYTGILQRIAVCSLLAGMLYLAIKPRYRTLSIATAAFLVLAGYWALLRWFPVPGFGAGHLDSIGSLPAYLDRRLISAVHLWPWGLTPGHGVTYDADGILSTLGSLPNLLAGIFAGQVLLSLRPAHRKALLLLATGAAVADIGALLGLDMPMIKRIWTPSFTIWSAGMTLMIFAGLYWLLDIAAPAGLRKVSLPLQIFGTNALLAFAFSTIITAYLDALHIGQAHRSLHAWTYLHGFAGWLPPRNASLAYALAILALNFALLYPFYRRRIFLRL